MFIILVCLLVSEANLQAFHKNSGLQLLYVTAKQNSEDSGIIIICRLCTSDKEVRKTTVLFLFYLGVKTDTRAIVSLTCMVLRKGLPPVPLPLFTVDNIISFPLPVKFRQNQAQSKEVSSLSESSSTKTTSSDLLSQIGPKESTCEGQAEVEEGLCISGVSTSMASTSLVPFLATRVEEDTSKDLLVRDSDSDSNNNASNHGSDAGDLRASIHILGTSCSSSRAESDGRSLVASSVNGEVDDKVRTNLEQFVNYFPEVSERKNYWFPSQSLPHSCNCDPNQWTDLKGISSHDQDSKVVVVPTATECGGGSTEDLSNSKDLPIAISVKKNTVKSAMQFVEEPLPQVLGPHQLPPHPEPVYSKPNSVDR